MGFNIPSSAQINWETLALDYTVQSDGYVEILVANESDVPTFFDNIHVTLEESMIVQESLGTQKKLLDYSTKYVTLEIKYLGYIEKMIELMYMKHL